MMIARWIIDSRFGHRQDVIALMHRWWREIAPKVGWSEEQVQILSTAVGAKESTIEAEIILNELADLDKAWSRQHTIFIDIWYPLLQPFGTGCLVLFEHARLWHVTKDRFDQIA